MTAEQLQNIQETIVDPLIASLAYGHRVYDDDQEPLNEVYDTSIGYLKTLDNEHLAAVVLVIAERASDLLRTLAEKG